jgi:hypothetical protein
MLLEFRSAAGGSVLYTGAVGGELLALLGREPKPRGVITVADIPATLATLAAALSAERARGKSVPREDEEAPVSLAQRLQPFVELLQRARAAGKDVTWGL